MTERRKKIPDRVKLIVALRAMGLEIEQVEWDHQPALALRDWNAATMDTIPPANDPIYIQMLRIAEHRCKTFGRGGEKRTTTHGSDLHAIAKVRRLSAKEEEFRRRILTKDTPTAFLAADHTDRGKRATRWPSRPFPKRKPKS